ncbi:hypothetical protein AJ78_04481 [Emergomyces pasteurianus Ep9510]|uniref:Uncharacterized protein n=1 Tax=Emergomyces pasteurianus Ep9510 TaxID=1447872 RepID=A0A1J9Q4X4_9EURO|nr:hypothetical protein AJ78_04481 [Emergomyces pasteurianus Ep9510]
MNLMQKYSKDDDAIGVDNLNRWPFNSLAVSFLFTTSSADSVEELRQDSTSIPYLTGNLL